MRLPVHGSNLVTGQEVNIEPFFHGLRRLDQQLSAVRNHAADMVGQTAVRKADVVALFVHDNLGVFVQAPKARRSRSPSCIAADNKYSHVFPLYVLLVGMPVKRAP
jgi:hypothetical protein